MKLKLQPSSRRRTLNMVRFFDMASDRANGSSARYTLYRRTNNDGPNHHRSQQGNRVTGWRRSVSGIKIMAQTRHGERYGGEIGPVDNSDLVQQIIKDTDGNDFVQLKPGAFDNLEMFPKDAWDLIVEWYGIMPGSLPIIRHAHNTNPDRNGIPNVVYELNPPVFKVHRLWGENNPVNIPQMLKVSNPATPIFVCSTSTKYVDFLEKIKEKVSIDKSKKVKIWRVPRLLPAADPTASVSNAATPPSSRYPVGSLRIPGIHYCWMSPLSFNFPMETAEN
jgi:hypothetical protein